MTHLLNTLASNRVLLISFVLMVLCGAGFGLFADDLGGPLLDELFSASAAEERLAQMNGDQKNLHFWVTVLLDTAYPIFYGAFFIGLIARLSGDHRRWAIWPSMIGVDADFFENAVQALALSGNTSLLFLKDILTPLKFGGLAIGLLLIIAFGIGALVRRVRS